LILNIRCEFDMTKYTSRAHTHTRNENSTW